MTPLDSDQETTIAALAEGPPTADLAVIIVSTNEANWLRGGLPSVFEHAGDAKIDVVVVDNSSTDGTRELVESEFPDARVVASENLGFGHANNRGVMTCDAPYVLFLNPDTEILAGTFGELLAAMEEREPRRRPRRRDPADRRRYHLADDSLPPERNPFSRRSVGLREVAGACALGRRA